MKRRLFEDLVVSAGGGGRGRGRGRGFAVPVSMGIHAAVVGGVLLFSALGPAELMPEVTARPTMVFPTPAVVQVATQPPAIPRPASGLRLSGGGPGVRPPAPPNPDATGSPEPDEVDAEAVGCVGPDCIEGLPPGPPTESFTIGDGVGAAPPSIVRPGGDIAPPVKIRNVEPVYPEVARRAGVEGIVILECTIDPKGRIASARVLRGHPLLDRAAVDAVEKWAYTPTLLNGSPVSVVMTVTVRFIIAR